MNILRKIFLVLLLTLLVDHFITEATIKPLAAQTSPAAGNTDNTPPFIEIIPGQNGREIEVVGTLDNSSPTPFFANIDSIQQLEDGPTGFKDSYTMTYSQTAASYLSIATGFTPQVAIVGTVNVTSTTGVDTSKIAFNRAYLEANLSDIRIQSADSLLQIRLPNTNTLTFDTYVAVTDNETPPGAPVPGQRIIGKSYSVRAPKGVPTAAKAMILQIFYDPADLNGVDPHSLAIFAWNGTTKQWENEGGELVENSPLEAPHVRLGNVREFTVYALMTTTTWRDVFTDLDGLVEVDDALDIAVMDGAPALALLEATDHATARSRPIAPAGDIQAWDVISYSAQMAPPTSTVRIDLLSVTNTVIISNVTNGASLASLDPQRYPTLRLQVTMSATTDTAMPSLGEWQVSWHEPAPLTLRVTSAEADLADSMTISVTLSDAPMKQIGALAFAISYDPAVLDATNCAIVPTTLLLSFCNANFDNDGNGRDAARFTLIADQIITRTTTLATVTFTVVGRAAQPTALQVNQLQLTDAQGAPLPVIGVAGAVTVAPGLAGDVNCDGVTDNADASYILQYDAGLRSSAPLCHAPQETLFLPHCDMNGDGVCDLLDALSILLP
ncbi:MAG: cohesin domain-containing protein [Caldilineaceae bacterium]